MIKKAAAAAVIIIIAILAIYYSMYMRKNAARDYIEATGVIEATEVELAPKTSGIIEWECCKEGDSVKAGTVVARMESAALKARRDEAQANVLAARESIEETRASLENAKAQDESSKFDIAAAQAEVVRLKAVTEDAKTNLQRSKGLLKDGYIPQKDLDAAQTLYDSDSALLNSAIARVNSARSNQRTALANIKVAEARISTAEARKAQAQAQLKAVEADLNDTQVVSPVDAVVAYKSFETGETVSPGASIYTVYDYGNVWARVDVEETDIGKVRLGAPVSVWASGVPQRVFDGKVIEIGQVGEFATQKDVTRGRQDIKTFRVKSGITKPGGYFKAGMTVTVRISFSQGK